jgi:hypothetical protein
MSTLIDVLILETGKFRDKLTAAKEIIPFSGCHGV